MTDQKPPLPTAIVSIPTLLICAGLIATRVDELRQQPAFPANVAEVSELIRAGEEILSLAEEARRQ